MNMKRSINAMRVGISWLNVNDMSKRQLKQHRPRRYIYLPIHYQTFRMSFENEAYFRDFD